MMNGGQTIIKDSHKHYHEILTPFFANDAVPNALILMPIEIQLQTAACFTAV